MFGIPFPVPLLGIRFPVPILGIRFLPSMLEIRFRPDIWNTPPCPNIGNTPVCPNVMNTLPNSEIENTKRDYDSGSQSSSEPKFERMLPSIWVCILHPQKIALYTERTKLWWAHRSSWRILYNRFVLHHASLSHFSLFMSFPISQSSYRGSEFIFDMAHVPFMSCHCTFSLLHVSCRNRRNRRNCHLSFNISHVSCHTAGTLRPCCNSGNFKNCS